MASQHLCCRNGLVSPNGIKIKIITLKFIFKPIFEIKIPEKSFSAPTKFDFRRPIFENLHKFAVTLFLIRKKIKMEFFQS